MIRLGGIAKGWRLYVLLLPALVYLILFQYVPMYGVLIAFKDFNAVDRILGSPWAGFVHFQEFFESYVFKSLLTNTLKLSVFSLLISFPIPILFALLLNQIRSRLTTRFVQTGNGKADEIGLAMANKDVHSGIGSFGRNANDFGQWFGLWGQADRSDSLSVDANGKIFSTATTDAYKTGVEYLHGMYKDGLIDPEFLITDGPKLQAKMTNPEVIVGSLMTFSISDVVGADRAKDYAAVPYLKGPGGEMGTRENYSGDA